MPGLCCAEFVEKFRNNGTMDFLGMSKLTFVCLWKCFWLGKITLYKQTRSVPGKICGLAQIWFARTGLIVESSQIIMTNGHWPSCPTKNWNSIGIIGAKFLYHDNQGSPISVIHQNISAIEFAFEAFRICNILLCCIKLMSQELTDTKKR